MGADVPEWAEPSAFEDHDFNPSVKEERPEGVYRAVFKLPVRFEKRKAGADRCTRPKPTSDALESPLGTRVRRDRPRPLRLSKDSARRGMRRIARNPLTVLVPEGGLEPPTY